MNQDDESIECNGQSFSMRKILEEDGWEKYCKASETVRSIVRIQVKADLYQMEKGFMELNKIMKKE